MKKLLSQTIISGLSILGFSLSTSYAADIACVPSKNCEEMGYKQSATDCPDGAIKCPWDTTKLFCSDKPKGCGVGSILYFDKSCSYTVVSGKQPIAVVFDTTKKLAVSLMQPINFMSWGSAIIDIPDLENCRYDALTCGTDGKANTAAIIAYGQANGTSYPAAEFCAKYSINGTNRGDWYLPSIAELSSLYTAKDIVNSSIELLRAIPISDSPYWSSNENSSYNAGEFDMNRNESIGNYKSSSSSVRAIIAY